MSTIIPYRYRSTNGTHGTIIPYWHKSTNRTNGTNVPLINSDMENNKQTEFTAFALADDTFNETAFGAYVEGGAEAPDGSLIPGGDSEPKEPKPRPSSPQKTTSTKRKEAGTRTRIWITAGTGARLNIAKYEWIKANGRRITTDEFLGLLLNEHEKR